MKKIFVVALFATTVNVNAQTAVAPSRLCSETKIRSLQTQSKTTIANSAENDYDVQHVKMDLNIANNTSTQIQGHVTTTAKVVATNMSNYVFELSTQLTIDSAKINGQLLNATNNNGICTIQLPAALNQSTVFTAEVFYHGQPTGGNQFFNTGLQTDQSNSWGTDVTFTLSEPYEASDWWPCKQALQDKIDSATMWITVPNNLKAGANGLLTQVTAMPGNLSRYEWETHYPTDYYLLSFAVAPYTDYSSYVHFPNSSDSMLMQHFVYSDNAQTLPFWKNEIDSVKDILLFFSEKVGRYPFWKEKYGHCMAPLNGGMEHQTMTTLGSFLTELTAHELFHQWFGDHVTCATWKDIWLNEGFASYAEDLFYEHFRGSTAFKADMQTKHNSVLQFNSGTVYVDDTTNENRIFDERLTYNKGASVVHSLRFVCGSDSLFFALLRDYQQHFAFSTATTDQFKNQASQFLQTNLDTFINQWVYGEGYPIYAASWNQNGNDVMVKLQQSVTPNASVTQFYTPIELKLTSAQGDTIVRVHNSQATQTYFFKWNNTMNGMSIDPNDWLLHWDQGVTQDTTLTHIADAVKEKIVVYPNPSTTGWQVKNLPNGAQLQVVSMTGTVVWKGVATQKECFIPSVGLATGTYVLSVQFVNGERVHFTLIR